MAAGALRKVSPVVVRVNPRKVRARASLRLPAKARVRVNLRLPVKDKGRVNLRLQVKDRVKLRLQGKVKATKTVKTPLGKVNKAAGLLRPQPLF